MREQLSGTQGPPATLDFIDHDPVVGSTYRHKSTPEHLVVGAVGYKGKCTRCKGLGHYFAAGGADQTKRKCEPCKATGVSPGSVVCYHPSGENRRELKLIWEFDEFVEQFRRADGVGTAGDLFDEAAPVR